MCFLRDEYGSGISIHVPTRGTTMKCGCLSGIFRFQFTSPQGGRRTYGTTIDCTDYISIHVPTRGTTLTDSDPVHHIIISIHVPTRGTTIFFFAPVEKLAISIHVPTRGTTLQYSFLLCRYLFQFTSPQGGRPRKPGP